MPLSRAWPAPTDRDVTTAADQKCHATRAVAVSLRKSSLASITVTAARTARSRAWPAQRTRWLRARLPRGVSHRHNRDHGGRSAPCARPKRCRSAPCARPGAGANVHALVAGMARSYEAGVAASLSSAIRNATPDVPWHSGYGNRRPLQPVFQPQRVRAVELRPHLVRVMTCARRWRSLMRWKMKRSHASWPALACFPQPARREWRLGQPDVGRTHRRTGSGTGRNDLLRRLRLPQVSGHHAP